MGANTGSTMAHTSVSRRRSRLFDEPGHGAEVFSLLRDSHLEGDEYIQAFFATGSERQGVAE